MDRYISVQLCPYWVVGAKLSGTNDLGESLLQIENKYDRLAAFSHGREGMEFDFDDWVFRFGDDASKPIAAPIWFRWAMKFGASVKPQLIDKGHLATLVVTAPCDSAIAGVIAYGASLLSVPYAAIEPDSTDLFDQFMAAPAGTEIKRMPVGSEKGVQRFMLLSQRSEDKGIAMRKLNGRNKGDGYFMTRKTRYKYAFKEVETSTESAERSLAPHVGLSLTQSLLGQLSSSLDWHASLDAVVLCSPTQGAAQLRRETDAISISDLISECEMESADEADEEVVRVRRITLTDLLSISQWHLASDRECPSYCQFVNASTTRLSEVPSAASTVIFNGPDAYLRLNSRFSNQTHVVVISRNADPGKLERFMNVADSVRESAAPIEYSLPLPPFGIQLACLGDRRPKEKQW